MTAAVAEALADVGCTACGRVYEGQAAYTIGHDGGCMTSPDAHGQLVQLRDGRWAERWRHPGGIEGRPG